MRILFCGIIFGCFHLLLSVGQYVHPDRLGISKDSIIVNGLIIAMTIFMVNAGSLKRWYGYLVSEIILIDLLARYFDFRPLLFVKAILSATLMIGAVVDFIRTRKERAAEEAESGPL